MHLKHITAIGLAVLGGAAGVSAAQGAAESGSVTSDTAYFSPSSARTQIKAVQADQAASFAMFRRAPTASDALPAGVRSLLGETAVTGKNVDLARAVTTAAGTAWVVPGDGAICIALPDPVDIVGLGCATTQFAAKYGALAELYNPGDPDTRLVGILLPDGGSATVLYENGKSDELLVPNADGAVLTNLSGASAIRFEGPGGTRLQQLDASTM